MRTGKSIVWFYVLLWAFFISSLGVPKTFANVSPLPVDQAFIARVIFNSPQLVSAEFNIAPGYYLYSQRLHIAFNPAISTDIRYPQGEVKYDAHRGNYSVYTGNLVVPIALNTDAQQVKITLDYQGCSEHGFCYPPMQKSFEIDLAKQQVTPIIQDVGAKAAVTTSLQTLLTDQNRVNAVLASQHLGMMLLIFIGLGLLLAFTPCVLPMIPILTSIIVGQKEIADTKKAFALSTVYVLGSAITYAFAGMIAALMGSSLQLYLEKPLVIAFVSGLFILLALSLFGFYDLHIPRRWQSNITSISRKQKGGTYFGAFIMGMVSSLIVSPCVTAPLVGVLMYIAKTGDMLLGASALFALGVGMGIPLIAIGTSAGKLMPHRGPWMIVIQRFFGVLMVGMAIWLLTRIHSLPVILLFSGVVLLAITIYFKIYKNNTKLSMTTGVASVILILGSVAIPFFVSTTSTIRHPANSFIVVRNTEELNKQLLIARSNNKPVLLDFYATWCASCVAMDQDVFDLPAVQKALSQFVLLRADLSANNSADELLLKTYSIVAPPTVLFFNNKGKEVNSRRIVGEVNAKDFLNRLNLFFTASCDTKIQC